MNSVPVNLAESPADPVRNRRRGADSANDVPAAAFDALLNVTRTMAQATTLSQTRTAPAQMFEPAVVDPREQRITEMKNEAGSTRASPADQRGATEPQGDSMPPVVPNARGDARPRSHPSPGAKSAPAMHVTQPPAPRPEPANAPALHTAESVGKPAVQPKAMPAVSPPNMASPVPAGTKNASSATVARQVAEVLAAPRAGQSGEPKALASTTPAATASPQGRAATTKTPSTESKPSPHPARPAVETTPHAEDTPFARLIRSIRLQVGERTSSARLQLHPPELGRMRVDVRLNGDRIALDVRTETEAARELVARRAGELKSALAEQGIYVERLDVSAYAPRPIGEAKSTHVSADPPDSTRRSRSESRTSENKRRLWDTTQLDVHA